MKKIFSDLAPTDAKMQLGKIVAAIEVKAKSFAAIDRPKNFALYRLQFVEGIAACKKFFKLSIRVTHEGFTRAGFRSQIAG